MLVLVVTLPLLELREVSMTESTFSNVHQGIATTSVSTVLIIIILDDLWENASSLGPHIPKKELHAIFLFENQRYVTGFTFFNDTIQSHFFMKAITHLLPQALDWEDPGL